MAGTTTRRILRAMSRTGFRTRILTAIALAGVLTSSCDVHGISEPGSLASIVVTPNTTLAAGSTQQMIAVGYDAEGRIVPISPDWSIAASGGTVNSSGLFSAGTTTGVFANTVVATVGGVSGAATITVTAGPLSSITVTPSPVVLAIGGTQTFVAVGRDATGNVVTITPTWSVINGGGSISATGVFTAGTASGTYPNTVQASSGGRSGTATVVVNPGALSTVTVSPNPATLVATTGQQRFQAVGRDANGNVVSTTATWSVEAGGGTIDATGLFTAGSTTGTFTNTVRGIIGGISGFATVNVIDGSVSTITVTPNPVAMAAGATQQFTAVGRDAGGNVVAISPTWTVTNGGGTINPVTGLFTAGATPGTFANTVTATSGSVSGSATVTVTGAPPAVVTITVTPNPATVPSGNTQSFTATGRDAGGNIVSITPVWSVENGGGTINAASGLFTAGTVAGTFNNTVRATSGTVFGSATVTVTAVVTPPAPIVNLGTAAPNGIMAGTAVTCVSGGIINADVSIAPGNTVTGFGPCVITGVQHLNDGIAVQAQIDLTNAYNTLAGLPCPASNAIVANLGGTTKPAGVYCTASGIGVTGTLTLDGGGNPNATFVFQAGTSLTTAGNIVLINGAQAKNVYWQVGSSATIGTGSQWQGNILALTSITLVDNATLFGRALARNGAVSLGSNNVITLP